ncbi:MAG: hypothetical protein ACW964_00165 [Candidatus Hodarchaeales archaeon]
MKSLRGIILIIITTSVVSLNFLPILSQDNDPDKYILLVYHEEDRINPGDLVTLKAELFLRQIRLISPNNVRIEGIFHLSPSNTTLFSLEHEGNGIFTYSLAIPKSNRDYDLTIRFKAYFIDDLIATNSMKITIEKQISTSVNPDLPLFTPDVDLTIRIGFFLCVLGILLLAEYGIKRTKS